jgi:hypothetical protein
MSLGARIKKMEQTVFGSIERAFEVVALQYGESREQALERMEIDMEETPADVVFIRRFTDPQALPAPEPPADNREKARSIIANLQRKGFDMESIEKMVSGEMEPPENEPSPIMEPPPAPPPPPPKREAFDVQPMIASDLVGLFKKRPFRR